LKRNRAFLLLLFITTVISVSVAFRHYINPYSKRFSEATSAGVIKTDLLREASGMVCSRNNPGMIWVINDSGNTPDLHLVDKEGELIQIFRIDNTFNFDWEDLAIYTNTQTAENSLFIGDIGDNFAIRDHIKVFELEEPVYTDSELPDTILEIKNTYCFKYEDGPRDAETLMIDPINGEILIISKREQNVRIYRPAQPLVDCDTIQLEYLNSIPFYNVTAGDISINGQEILLKNYNAVFYWQRDADATIVQTLLKPHELLQYVPEPQGESIAWNITGTGYYTLSEKNGPNPQILYYYKRLEVH